MPTGDLLSQAKAALQDNDTGLMQALALSCHGRMLELADTEKHEAIRHALAGAELLQALAAPSEDLPDWLAIHEEQCCRYGCIWIHELLEAGDQAARPWAADALRLLARMEQLHTEPVGWAPIIQASLQNHQGPACSIKDPPRTRSPITTRSGNPAWAKDQRITIVGNCQCHPLMLSLRQALPNALIHFCPSVHLATREDVEELHRQLGSADLLITHRIQPGYRNGIGLDTATLRTLLAQHATALVLPNLHYEGHHPFIGYALDPTGSLAAMESDTPLGSYHDFLAMAASSAGIRINSLLQNPPPEVIVHIRRLHHQSIQELALREQDCDIRISDWIEQQFHLQPLMHTINHPNQICLDQILRRLICRIDSNQPLQAGLYDLQEHLGDLSIPIHPWVQQAFDLGPWASSWGQRRGTALCTSQQLEESLHFYHLHPWVIEQNRQHPKFQLAHQLLTKYL